jgi:enoyl-CoA hydratase/carnithine racemase
MSVSEHLSIGENGGLLTLTLRRPEKLNAITLGMRDVMAEGLARFAGRDDLRVLLVRAEGRYFSAGMDIAAMGSMPDAGIALRREYRHLHELFDSLENVEKPVVFAIQGPCLGGALEMALSADFRLASTAATFALPEIKLGVIPGSGGTSRLTHLVGRGWARWLAMAGQPVKAAQALEIGLVQAVYEAGAFDAEVDRFVAHLLALPSEAMGLAKLAIELSAGTDRAMARHVERVANTVLISSDEHKAAVARFRDQGSS